MENPPHRQHAGSALRCARAVGGTRHRPAAARLKALALLGLWSLAAPAQPAAGSAGLALATGSPPPLGLSPAAIDLLTPPGRRVEVDGQPMHLFCAGEGPRTVVLDSGLGGFSLEWLPVQSRLAEAARVCSYDRAGYGWSGSRIGPRTSSAIVEELHGLLTASGEQGPYLLVGHSFGGYTVQLFAKRYPDDTAGVVLVDASHPEQHVRFPERAARGERTPTTGGRRYATATPTLPAGFPMEFAEVAYHLMYARKAVGTQRRELADFDESGREVAQAGALPERPLVVITRGQRVWPTTEFGDEMERVWTVLQNELAHASRDATHWIARDSGHYVHLDEPDLVAEAVGALVAHIDCGDPLPVRPPEAGLGGTPEELDRASR